jgi:hypothetical protein
LKKIIALLVFLFLIVPCAIHADGDISAQPVKPDKKLAVTAATAADPNVHQAIYNILSAKKISCSGLETKKDGTVTVKDASADVAITDADIQAELVNIKTAADNEALIQTEIVTEARAAAVAKLIKDGTLPKGYIDKGGK